MLKRLGMAMALTIASAPATAKTDHAALDTLVKAGMAETGVKGIAIAYIDQGKIVSVDSWGVRNAGGDPLTIDTVMYGASLTKAVFGYFVMQLAQEGRIDLDRSIASYLRKPLPDYTGPEIEERYARWSDLAGDERWRKLTPRILLNHGSGFANFGFLEPDGKLRFHFDPGTHYAYSGAGIILLQFVIEQGLGMDIGVEMRKRVFDRVGATRTSMTWRPDFAGNLADGWTIDGKVEPHDQRGKPRAAGSMDTTITDMAKIAAAYLRGKGLKPAARAELLRPQFPITTRSQFPTLQPDLPVADRYPGLSAALGMVTFPGPRGPGFFRGGHNDSTGNIWVCVEARRRCVVILSNDVRAEALFPRLTRALLGDTGMPWSWVYGDLPWTKP